MICLRWKFIMKVTKVSYRFRDNMSMGANISMDIWHFASSYIEKTEYCKSIDKKFSSILRTPSIHKTKMHFTEQVHLEEIRVIINLDYQLSY